MKWDNLADGELKDLKCPNCNTELQVPWTTCCQSVRGNRNSDRSLAEDVDEMLASGEGFSDRGFRARCHRCLNPTTHDNLRAAKFCADVKRLLVERTPMPGTILGLKGFPFRYDFYRDDKWKGVFNKISNLLLLGLGQRILDQPRLGGEGNSESISRIRDLIGEFIAMDRDYMRKVRDSASHQMTRLERIGFRKMMSRYWENSSPFALDLVGAVIRQGSFIEKMHNIDWLHSPALPATMTRLILKYERFVVIMNDPTNMAVPTLDVDLAWHTHQLNPASYMDYVVRKTGQFIDHDDKVAETALNDAFAWTSKVYEKKYGGKYSECTCWYCEAVREQNTSTVSRIFSSKGKDALQNKSEQDPKKCVHISAHNAVRPADDAKYTAEAQIQADKLEAAYQKACARAEKKGAPPPKRDDYYWSTAYGKPPFATSDGQKVVTDHSYRLPNLYPRLLSLPLHALHACLLPCLPRLHGSVARSRRFLCCWHLLGLCFGWWVWSWRLCWWSYWRLWRRPVAGWWLWRRWRRRVRWWRRRRRRRWWRLWWWWRWRVLGC